MDKTLIANFAAALLAIVNPIGNLPIFISYTAGERQGVQRWLALFISVTILGFLLLFLLTGTTILKFFGISIAAFRIAGGILLLLTGIGMVRGQQMQRTHEIANQAQYDDLVEAESVYRKILIPLGIPIFVGPGSISTVILYGSQARDRLTFLALMGIIVAVALFTLLVLMGSLWTRRVLGKFGLDIATRILGLFLAAIGVQFILSGLADATVNFISPDIQ
ncbi:MarC family protein [Alkalinema sp. FACHB-956]|uniref:MarC family protein n=1 Tax=Alkalinema sp. FACHB-956 TaxID=2692768 RepID=UPI0016867200|nr:MarC family protein [Alkalinema sp. FACHB-956]MBD2326109.1 MarC family protein [Alkalinema sp. FACHB-956]